MQILTTVTTMFHTFRNCSLSSPDGHHAFATSGAMAKNVIMAKIKLAFFHTSHCFTVPKKQKINAPQ